MKTRIQITASVQLNGSLLLLGEMMLALHTTLCSQHYIETYIIKWNLNSGVTETNTMEPKTSDINTKYNLKKYSIISVDSHRVHLLGNDDTKRHNSVCVCVNKGEHTSLTHAAAHAPRQERNQTNNVRSNKKCSDVPALCDSDVQLCN